jgi:aminomethyltransferase
MLAFVWRVDLTAETTITIIDPKPIAVPDPAACEVPLHILPLEQVHVAAGAKFCPFAGWHMPLNYALGVMKEHLHTRAAAGLFDISHMKLIAVDGSDASAFLSYALPIQPAVIAEGQSKLSFLLNENAGIEDDLIVTRLSETRFMIVANASRWADDVSELTRRAANFDVAITPQTRVILALQGPHAEQALLPIAKEFGLGALPQSFMTGVEPKPDWFVTRSGYTGEDGFEIAMPVEGAADFATALAAEKTVEWIGLAARDSLRLEAGLCLHGNDIDAATDPVSANLLWAIPKAIRADGVFVGADALSAIIAKGPSFKRVGLKAEGRQPVRGGVTLNDESGTAAGRVTSGGFGPSADHPVAMGYVRADLAAPGTRIIADVRGRPVPMIVSPLPFTPHNYRKG